MKKIQEISLLLDKLRGDNAIQETLDVFRIYDLKLISNHFFLLKEVSLLIKQVDKFELSITLDTGDDLDLTSSFEGYENAEVIIKVKKGKGRFAYFFSEQGLFNYLSLPDALNDVEVIYTSVIRDRIEAYSTAIVPFSSEYTEFVSSESIRLIKYVKPVNLEAQSYLANDLSKWITKAAYVGKAFSVWIDVTVKKMLCALASELSVLNNEASLQILGERRKRIVFDLNFSATSSFYELLTEMCFWIYLEGKDVDSRHSIINFELSKVITDELKIENGNLHEQVFRNAYENSKLVYRYHLINSSKDLNKTLTDLNKSLFEYTSKIRQNTIDLVNNLWRDFATAFGVLVINYSIKKPDIGLDYFKYLGFALCAYLLVSFSLSTNVNFWYYKTLSQNLKDWKPKIYAYLSDVEFEKFTLHPLRRAQQKYIFTFWWVLIFYLIMMGAVVIFLSNKQVILAEKSFKAEFTSAVL